MSAAHKLAKGLAEVFGAKAVDQRIYCRVAIAEPKEDSKDAVRRTVVAEGSQQIDREEWRPAEYEAAYDDAYRLGRFLLAVQPTKLVSNLEHGGLCISRSSASTADDI